MEGHTLDVDSIVGGCWFDPPPFRQVAATVTIASHTYVPITVAAHKELVMRPRRNGKITTITTQLDEPKDFPTLKVVDHG